MATKQPPRLDHRFFEYAKATTLLTEALGSSSRERLLKTSGFFDEFGLERLSDTEAGVLKEAVDHLDDLIGILLLAAATRIEEQYTPSVIATLQRISREPQLVIESPDLVDGHTIAEIERYMKGNSRDPQCIVDACLAAITQLKSQLRKGRRLDHETVRLVDQLQEWFRKFGAKKRTRIVEKEPSRKKAKSRAKTKFIERGSADDFFETVLPPLNKIVRAYGGRPFSQSVLSKKIARKA